MKKFFVVMMCLIMTVCFMPTMAFATEGNEVLTSDGWDGVSVDTNWYNDADTTFTISTAAQLAGLAQLVNGGNNFSGKTITIGADIDLNNQNWTPIGNGDKPFNGTFDGANHAISNLKVNCYSDDYVGFFGKTKNATLKALNLKNVDVLGNGDVGALVGCGYTGTISDVHVSGTIKITACCYIGGIAGEGYASITNCSVIADEQSDSFIKSDIRSSNHFTIIGGIRGYSAEGNIKTTDCIVKNIQISGQHAVGGILGNFHYGNTVENCKVENCQISATRAEYNWVGAIGGRTVNKSDKAITMKNCVSLSNTIINGSGETVSWLIPPRGYSDKNPAECDNIGVVVNGSNYQKENYENAIAAAAAVEAGNDNSIYYYANYNEEEAFTKTQAETLCTKQIALVPAYSTYKIQTLSAEAAAVYKIVKIDDRFYILENNNEPDYAAKIGDTYYTVADKAIIEAKMGDTVYLKEATAQNKTITFDEALTIVSEVEGAVWTGAVPDKNCKIITDTNGNSTTYRAVVDNEKAEAKIGDTYYATLSAAVNATTSGTIELLKNVDLGSSYITIGEGKDITLELNGYTVTGDASYVFYMSSTGKLAVRDSGTNKTGTIQGNKSYGIYTKNSTVTVVVKSGNIVGKTTGLYGYYGGTITIDGGKITGGKYGLDMYDKGTCTLNGGTIEGGTYSVYVRYSTANVNITGGMYSGAIYKKSGNVSISGGYFTNDPTAYLASRRALVDSDKVGFAYKVGVPAKVGEAEVHPAPDTTPAANIDNITDENDKTAVENAIKGTSSSGLNAEAAAIAGDNNKITDTHVEIGLEELKKSKEDGGLGLDDSTVASDIKLVVQPYLDINANNYTTTDTEKKLAVEITPKYNLLATKIDTDIKTLDTTSEDKNAVVVSRDNLLPVDQDTQVTINFQLPSGFITDDAQMNKVFVVHTKKDGSKETYKANVTKSGDKYIATFTTNGFSPFVFMVDSRTATVTFDGTSKTYVASNVGEVLPTSTAPSGKVFGGWTFEGISGTYATLTDDLLTALNGRTVTATPYFYTPNYGGGGSTVTTPLDTAKSEASKAVSEYVKSSDYEAAEQAEIKAITEKAMADIKNAKTEAEVKTIEAAAKAEIDKLETAEEKAIIRTVEATKFKARSKATTLNGKKAIRVTWNVPEGMEFDGFEVYRSTEKYKGFGTEPIFITQNQKYTNNKGLEVGKTYYYKVRAFKYVNDEKVYTEYSYKAIRTVK